MAASRRSNRRRAHSRDGFRQIATVVGLGTALIGGLFAGGYALQDQLPDLAKVFHGGAGIKVASAGNGSGGVYTGSILFLPIEGPNCRQIEFDNRDGRFTDNGYVDCAKASEQSGINSPKQWSAARAKVISMGFHDR